MKQFLAVPVLAIVLVFSLTYGCRHREVKKDSPAFEQTRQNADHLHRDLREEEDRQ